MFDTGVVRRIALVLALGLVLAGCAPAPLLISAVENSPTLFVHNVQGRGDEAQVGGLLRYLDGPDCFVFESPPGVEPVARSVAVWPPGTRIWWRSGRVGGVDTPVIGAIPLGSRVVGGGGSASPDTSDLDLPAVGPGCLTGGGEFAMVHVISAVHAARSG